MHPGVPLRIGRIAKKLRSVAVGETTLFPFAGLIRCATVFQEGEDCREAMVRVRKSGDVQGLETEQNHASS